jgi:hypothetical protein
MQLPKGLPRLDSILQRWIVRTRDVDPRTGCIFSAGAFRLDDREGPLRDHLHSAVIHRRAALRRCVLQAIDEMAVAQRHHLTAVHVDDRERLPGRHDVGHLRVGTDAEQVVSEIYALRPV